jgi:hypothetical protein
MKSEPETLQTFWPKLRLVRDSAVAVSPDDMRVGRRCFDADSVRVTKLENGSLDRTTKPESATIPLGRRGPQPQMHPPKRKNDRRRRIARELQRQREAVRRKSETAAAMARVILEGQQRCDACCGDFDPSA